MFKKHTVYGCMLLVLLVSLAAGTAFAQDTKLLMNEKKMMIVYYDETIQIVDMEQTRDSLKAIKNHNDERDFVRLVYCDGAEQKVKLIKDKAILRSYRFFCNIPDFGTPEKPKKDKEFFKGNIYHLAPGTKMLPADFSKLTPVGQIYTRHIDIPRQGFNIGFPGVTDRYEWFAIKYQGKFHFQRQKGDYKFRLVSDDGARLYIDKKLVIDNDGIHAVKSKEATVTLNAGMHHFRVDYFQGPKYEVALQLFVTPPGGKKPERIF